MEIKTPEGYIISNASEELVMKVLSKNFLAKRPETPKETAKETVILPKHKKRRGKRKTSRDYKEKIIEKAYLDPKSYRKGAKKIKSSVINRLTRELGVTRATICTYASDIKATRMSG